MTSATLTLSPTALRVLRCLAERGAQTAASVAATTGLRHAGALMALHTLREHAYVDNQRGGYWHLTLAGVDALRAQGGRGR